MPDELRKIARDIVKLLPKYNEIVKRHVGGGSVEGMMEVSEQEVISKIQAHGRTFQAQWNGNKVSPIRPPLAHEPPTNRRR